MDVSVFCGVSVDGFLARPNDGLDFLDSGGPEPHGFEEFLASVDVLVMGRRTFEVVQSIGDFSLYGERKIIVLSNRALPLNPGKDVQLEQMAGPPAEIVKQLRWRGLQHAYIDGGITIRQFLAAGLIDRLIISRVPVLIGSGVPLFGALPADIPLLHITTTSYPGGLVQSEYRIVSHT
jgi:dihydrofolate reductase